uniref:Uncharacterized protein n=1 Tax=Rhizophora mucronata TaxID=61149 RepID=A0A2P2QUJ2_RHIMU
MDLHRCQSLPTPHSKELWCMEWWLLVWWLKVWWLLVRWLKVWL